MTKSLVISLLPPPQVIVASSLAGLSGRDVKKVKTQANKRSCLPGRRRRSSWS